MDPGIEFMADKVHAHRWPDDSPEWDAGAEEAIGAINGTCRRRVEIRDGIVTVGGVEFRSVSKVGLSVPLFRRECTMVFEARFGRFSAHVHVTTRSEYIRIFGRLAAWRDRMHKSMGGS